ncbi:MAG: hypothetical protein QME05_01240 [Candidatus Margulisbacteria bacterium]|nr:hypothetical protein [Candidatus Margulisiibacteriota bacterium]
MLNKVEGAAKKFTVGDVYKEAAKMLKKEVREIKGNILPSEEVKMDELAKVLSKMVLKEMKVV